MQAMDRTPISTQRSRSAFTLVELLVVVSIIALLLAILLPALGKARDTARQVICTSNARGLAVGQLVWASDHRGGFLTDSPKNGREGQFNLHTRRIGKIAHHWADILVWEDYTAPEVFACPEDNVPLNQPDLRPHRITYGHNAFLRGSGHDGNTGNVAQPSARILIAETKGTGLSSVGTWVFRAPGTWHGADRTRTTYAYFDGHADIPSAQEVWGYELVTPIDRVEHGHVDFLTQWMSWVGPAPSGDWRHGGPGGATNAESFSQPSFAFWLK